MQWAAVGVGVAAVLVLAIGYGQPPWISLTLAFSFATLRPGQEEGRPRRRWSRWPPRPRSSSCPRSAICCGWLARATDLRRRGAGARGAARRDGRGHRGAAGLLRRRRDPRAAVHAGAAAVPGPGLPVPARHLATSTRPCRPSGGPGSRWSGSRWRCSPGTPCARRTGLAPGAGGRRRADGRAPGQGGGRRSRARYPADDVRFPLLTEGQPHPEHQPRVIRRPLSAPPRPPSMGQTSARASHSVTSFRPSSFGIRSPPCRHAPSPPPKILIRRAAAAAAAGTAAAAGARPPPPPPHPPPARARPGGRAALAAPDIPVANVKAHLTQLQSIATANGGNRAHGRAGYKASLDYVKAKLDAAGFTTTVQQFTSSGAHRLQPDRRLAGRRHRPGRHGRLPPGLASPPGPGINDNGSGSAAVLETALAVARAELPAHQAPAVRLVGRGGAGHGRLPLLRQQPAAAEPFEDRRLSELRHDRLAQPRLLRLRRRPGASRRPSRTTSPAIGIADRDRDRGRRPLRPRARSRTRASRSAACSAAPTTPRPRPRRQKWGGTAGEAFDRCYHSSCDTTSNINDTALDRNSDAIAHAIWTLSS